MTLLRDYLREKAKFHVPPSTATNRSSTSVKLQEVDLLEPEWRVKSAHHDPTMVDELLNSLDEYLGERTVEEALRMSDDELDDYFSPKVESNARGRFRQTWRSVANEAAASNLVNSGPLDAATDIIEALLGITITVSSEQIPNDAGYSSKVDYVIKLLDNRVLLEMKNYVVLRALAGFLGPGMFPIDLKVARRNPEKVIHKAALYMGSHQVHWLILSSFESWFFLRFHNDEQAPYITYSSCELQKDNTRPFRALLAILINQLTHRDIPSRPATTKLVVIDEASEKIEKQKLSARVKEKAFNSMKGLDDRWKSLLRRVKRKSDSADLMIKWSEDVTPHGTWTHFYFVEGAGETYSHLPSQMCPVLLRLRRLLGVGSTGIVYEAIGPSDEDTETRSYAVKMVMKGSFELEEGRIDRLLNEFRSYHILEKARSNRRVGNEVPRCYGLYESEYSLALITEYEGEVLTEEEWDSLSLKERTEFFKTVVAIHSAGIEHRDISASNVIRKSDGSFRLIDFSESTYHICPGINKLSGLFKSPGGSGGECPELKDEWSIAFDEEHWTRLHPDQSQTRCQKSVS